MTDFTKRFTRVFDNLLVQHGWTPLPSPTRDHISFGIGTVIGPATVTITNPSRRYGSKIADFVFAQNGSLYFGRGRDALADFLGIPRVA